MNVAVVPAPATLADLAREPGKAELIGGKVVPLLPTGYRPNIVAGRIFRRLADYAGRGVRNRSWHVKNGPFWIDNRQAADHNEEKIEHP